MLDPPCVVQSVSQMSAEWHPSSYVKGNYSYQKCYVLFTFFVNNINRKAEPKECRNNSYMVPDLGSGYKHLTVNHSKELKNKETGAYTNHIENSWMC